MARLILFQLGVFRSTACSEKSRVALNDNYRIEHKVKRSEWNAANEWAAGAAYRSIAFLAA